MVAIRLRPSILAISAFLGLIALFAVWEGLTEVATAAVAAMAGIASKLVESEEKG